MTNRYTSGEYLAKNADWHESDSVWKAAQILKMVERHGLHPQRLMEIGCGTGLVLATVQERLGGEVVCEGYDVSPQAIDRAQARTNERLHFFCQDVLEQPPAKADVVLLMDVIEHIEDYIGFLRAVRMMGEYVVFHIPLDLSVQSVARVSPILRERATVGHLHYFTKEIALCVLEETGYEVLDWMYTGVTTELPAKSFVSRLMQWPRTWLYRINPDLAARWLGGFSLMVLTRSKR